ncbi:hypothetical protein HKD37_02G003250 [Glycine soja]
MYQDLLALDWNVSLQHTLREANFCADWVAKYGANHVDSFISWLNSPSELIPLLSADVMGVVHVRS